MVGRFVQDLRNAGRSLAQSPGFTSVAVAILTLGIGANATIFTLVNGLFLKPPGGVGEPAGLVRVTSFSEAQTDRWWSYPDYVFYRDRGQVFAGLAAWSPGNVPMTASTGDRPFRVEVALVSANFFDVLQVRPAAGRGFTAAEGAVPGQAAVAVVSHGFFQRVLGSRPGVVGSTLRLNGHPLTVVGVAPRELRSLSPAEEAPDVWVPLTMQPVLLPSPMDWLNRVKDQEITWLQVLGRLGPGVSLEAAQANVDVLVAAFARDFPGMTPEGQGIKLLPTFQYSSDVREQLARLTGLLLAVVGLVLLVASANVAILLLARATARRKDFGVRVALGASRRQIVSQVLAESLLLALAGGAGGFLLAFWTADLASRAFPLELTARFAPDGRVLAVTLAVALVTAVLFGLAPALQASRADVASLIKRGDPGSGRSRPLEALVVVQVALSIVLVTGAALFVRSLRAAESVDLGFAAENRLLVEVDLGSHGYKEEDVARFIDQVMERTSALPGVRRVSTMLKTPFGGSWRTTSGEEEGGQEELAVSVNGVGPGYFETMGIPLVDGRGFGPQDRKGGARVAIINETLAARLWPGRSAVGQELDWRDGPVTVVGVARNALYHELGEAPVFFVYLPVLQTGWTNFHLIAETAGDPAGLMRPVEDAFHAVDPEVTLLETLTMEDVVERRLGRYRVSATLVTLFAALALTLAAVGLYGTLSYLVAQSRRSIGVRMTLGAPVRRIVRSVVARGLALAGIGIAVGIAAAWAASRLVAGMVYGVSPRDPVTFLLVSVVLVAVTCLASSLPALRASRVEPVEVLK